MSQIDQITPEQEARFSEWIEKWTKIGLSTEPADFEKSTEAALKTYELCGLEKPSLILHLKSPLGVSCAAAYAHTKMVEACNHNEDALTPEFLANLKIEAENWDWQTISPELRKIAAQGFNNYRGGQFWASWCAYVSFLRDVMGYQDETLKAFEIDEALTLNCGWVWWHSDILAISDRPLHIHLDTEGRFHHETEAAALYRDGFAIYAIHGVRVPEYVILRPHEITVEKIDAEENAEVRRVMLNRFGWANYLQQSNAKLIDQDVDQFGQPIFLYHKEIPDDETLAMVKVVNSTPEPDGTLKEYFLRVDPKYTRAKEAVASTFKLEANQYKPYIET